VPQATAAELSDQAIVRYPHRTKPLSAETVGSITEPLAKNETLALR